MCLKLQSFTFSCPCKLFVHIAKNINHAFLVYSLLGNYFFYSFYENKIDDAFLWPCTNIYLPTQWKQKIRLHYKTLTLYGFQFISSKFFIIALTLKVAWLNGVSGSCLPILEHHHAFDLLQRLRYDRNILCFLEKKHLSVLLFFIM